MSDYGFVHEGRVFTPDQSTIDPAENLARNQAIEAAELAHWAGRPDRMIGYYHFGEGIDGRQLEIPRTARYLGDDSHVTTWPGTRIGRIVSARVYRHNFGARFVSIRVIGSNGAEYYGRASFDGGSVIRLRKARS